MKHINLFVLMKGGLAPVEKSQNKLINTLFPDRSKMNITLIAGPTWADPQKLLTDLKRKKGTVATVYKVDDTFYADYLGDRKRLRKFRSMLADARPDESSWDVAMRLHEIETKPKNNFL